MPLSKQPNPIDPSWPLEKRLWWAIEMISNQCDGARKLDGKGFSKYDRPIADRIQSKELAKWTNWDIDEAIHIIRKYRGQLESMGIKIDDVIGDMGGVVEIDDNEDVVTVGAGELISPRVDRPEAPFPIVEVEDAKTVKMDIAGGGSDLSTIEFLTGAAGTGKTFEIRRRISENPNYALLTATTGIAAINLGTITLNSALGYYNTESLEESMARGWLERRLVDIVDNGYQNIVIDELSMMVRQQLDIIYEAIRRVNERSEWHGKNKLGLILTGDFCQLPPIPDEKLDKKGDIPWAFKADCWPEFDKNTVRLTKCWRQSDQKFLEAINLIRNGNGRDGVRILREIGIEFSMQSDKSFDGTTIIAKNKGVEDFNFVAHSRINGQMIRVKNSRWGKNRKEWENIPEELSLKIGAYVMILVNDAPAFTYVNGDCGHVKDFAKAEIPDEYDATIPRSDYQGAFGIELVRNNNTTPIGQITRFNYQKDAPRELGEDNRSLRSAYAYDPESDELPKSPCFDIKARKWIVGGITYYPLRLAYASTVHKCVDESTRIPTIESGFLQLKDINSLDWLTTPNGPLIKIVKAVKPAYRIETEYGYELLASAEHRWMTDRGLIETKDLLNYNIELARPTSIPGGFKIEADIAWVLGLLTGDGNYSDREYTIHMACKDEELGNRYKSIMEGLGTKCSWRSDRRGLHSTSKQLRESFYNLGLDYVTARDKRIPEAIWRSGNKGLSKYLCGLFDADGHVGISNVVFCTTSHQLAIDVHEALLAFGIISLKDRYDPTSGPYWQIRVCSQMLERFKSTIGFTKQDRKDKLSKLFPNRWIMHFDGYDKVTAVTSTGVDIPMVDIEIPSPHLINFGPFFGHNSQGLSLDRVQIDVNNHFMGSPAMCYVSLSRARNPEGLRIVGTPETLAEKVKCHPEVLKWL